MLEIAEALQQLPNVIEVVALSWKGDCRELLVVCSPEPPTTLLYQAVEITASGLEFTYALPVGVGGAMSHLVPVLATAWGKYIYDPGPALNKLHLADAAAQSFELQKLHGKTWLYTSDEMVPTWPGRIFELLTQPLPMEAKVVQQAIEQHQVMASPGKAKQKKVKAQVAVRNLELTAQQLATKLGLADGGDLMCFGVKVAAHLAERERVVLVCRRVSIGSLVALRSGLHG